MKKLTLIIFSIGLTTIYSCNSNEKKVKKIVDEFLVAINDSTKTVSKDLLTDDFAQRFKDKIYYPSKKWELLVKPQNDSIMIVEAKIQTQNDSKETIDIQQGFVLINKLDNWKIKKTYKLNSDYEAKDVVNEFLTQINDETKKLDSNLVTEKFAKFFKGQRYYTSGKWKILVKPKNDSIIIVEAKGNTHTGFGRPIETLQSFALTNKFGEWKIYNSFNLVPNFLDLKVVDTEWDFYWDRDKGEILKTLQEKLELKILIPGYRRYYSDYVEGKLKIINNSDYDIENIKILIEHFDNNGNSVNTDKAYAWGIIRKHGYREFDWLTSDCSKCAKQEYKINFIKESN